MESGLAAGAGSTRKIYEQREGVALPALFLLSLRSSKSGQYSRRIYTHQGRTAVYIHIYVHTERVV